MLQEGQQLDGLAQTHVVRQAGALVEAVEEGQPAQATLLVRPQLAAEPLRRWQRIRGLLLVVLLQHRLQPGASVEAMHRQTHQQIAFGGGDPQGIVQAELRVGTAEAFSVSQIVRSQFDPGPLVAHEGAAFAAQPLQFPQGECHPADHQIPAPVEGFAEAEAAGAFRQLRLDRQTQAAGQAPRQAGGKVDADAGIPQLPRCGPHQHEGFGGGQLHRVRRSGLQAPFDRWEHGEGASQTLQQHFTGLLDCHFSQLELVGTGGPGRSGGQLEARIRLRLQPKPQLPELFSLCRCLQFQAGACSGEISSDALAPMEAGAGQPFGLFITDLNHPCFGAQGVLPQGQQGIEAVGGWFKVLAQLCVDQILQQRGHPQAATAGPAAGHRVGGTHGLRTQPCHAVTAPTQWFPPGQGAGGHQRQAGGQILQASPVLLAVEQRYPSGPVGISLAFAQFHLGNPAPPGHKAEGPALQMAPPAQLIGQVWIPS